MLTASPWAILPTAGTRCNSQRSEMAIGGLCSRTIWVPTILGKTGSALLYITKSFTRTYMQAFLVNCWGRQVDFKRSADGGLAHDCGAWLL